MNDATADTKRPGPPRRVCLAGGGGFIGRALAAHFLARGDDVAVLTRTPGKNGGGAGVRRVAWNGRTLGPWADDVRGCDVLVNLAGKSVDCRYTAANRRAIYDSRLQSTAVLGEAIRTSPGPRPAVWLNASTATIYRHAEDRPQDEATGEITGDALPPGTPPGRADAVAPGWNEKWAFSVDVARRWEQTFFDADTGDADVGGGFRRPGRRRPQGRAPHGDGLRPRRRRRVRRVRPRRPPRPGRHDLARPPARELGPRRRPLPGRPSS